MERIIMSQSLKMNGFGQSDKVTDKQVDALFATVAAKAIELKRFPCALYRLQFNRNFTFLDAKNLAAYLNELGITDIYASPYLKARQDSLHGYDICDHSMLNPAIGSEEEYWEMIKEFKQFGLSQILDIVPNHMGIGEPCNRWWFDVLENGPSSIYSSFFDIDWNPLKEELKNKTLLPILGDQYGRALEKGELQVSFQQEEGVFYLHYYGIILPVNPHTYPHFLTSKSEILQQTLGLESEAVLEYQSIITGLEYLPAEAATDPAKITERNREKEILKRRLATLTIGKPEILEAILQSVREINGIVGDSRSFDRLDKLIEGQVYRLAYWRVAAEEINYRRFFDINDLAAIRVENMEVFEKTHQLVFRLVREQAVSGLRIDHPDGLWDPVGYFWRLQKRYILELCYRELSDELGQSPEPEIWAVYEQSLLERLEDTRVNHPDSPLLSSLYVVIEKILERREILPNGWFVEGTTGYDFCNQVNNLFVDNSNQKAFDELYSKFIGEKVKFADLVYQDKRQIMQVALSSELNMLALKLNRISEQDRCSRDFTLYNLRYALREVLACFPVYRTYIVANTGNVEKRDQAIIETAISRAKKRNPALDVSVFDFIRDILLLNQLGTDSEKAREMQYEFVMKFQQFSGPIMAKGLEDTSFYRYNRLISLNEVGGDPEQFGAKVEQFHRQNHERQRHWSYSLITTSTHDSKRSEDARARINTLSEMPRQWKAAVSRWARLNHRHRALVEGQYAPDRNEEYLLYQTLLGCWPIDTLTDEEYDVFIQRIQNFMLKALKEAKVHSSWINSNQPYDLAVQNFVKRILDRKTPNSFLDDFLAFQPTIAHFGVFNSLSQLLLKLTSPGVPDIYQGNEVWDFSLVDPDNRRPVNYSIRATLLAGLPESTEPVIARQLAEKKEDGRIKLFIIRQTLRFRNSNQTLFEKGAYLSLNIIGNQAEHICAFARTGGSQFSITVVPRLVNRLTGGALVLPLGKDWWKDNWLELPETVSGKRCFNIFTGEHLEISYINEKPALPLEIVLSHFPVALLVKEGNGYANE